jgi:hypothetical protein
VADNQVTGRFRLNAKGGIQVLVLPPTRFARWRLRSRACAVVDTIAAAAGVGLYALAAIDSLASWPSNRVLVSDPELSHVAEILLLPFWLWLLGSMFVLNGADPRRAKLRPVQRVPSGLRATFAVAAVLGVTVIAGGFAVGAAKGAVRILPGPRYQVSTPDVNQSAWTAISVAQFHLWQARFVREDAILMLFGLFLAAGCYYLLRLHRDAIHSSQKTHSLS